MILNYFMSETLRSPSDTIFMASAILGTVLFLLRMTMSFFGGGFFEENVDLEGFQDHADHHNGSLFKILTVHSLSGFLMMFGWSGLACTTQFGWAPEPAFGIALLCGTIMLIVTAGIMRGAMLFEGRGTVFSSKKTVGLVGTVYQRIPVDGQGKIHVVVNDITRELLAQSSARKALESFTLIKVVKAIDHETVEVIELDRTH